MKQWAFLLTMILFLMGAIAGCSSDSSDEKKASKEEVAEASARAEAEAEAERTPPICPQVAIVRELDTIYDYGGEKPAPDQLVSGARMKTVDGDCAYLKDGIDITFNLNLVAAKGPRLGGLRTSFPFFIAVVDPAEEVLNKDRMTAEFHFSSDEKTVEDAEALHVFIPLAKDKRQTGPAYQVLMGFQLTKEQLDMTDIVKENPSLSTPPSP